MGVDGAYFGTLGFIAALIALPALEALWRRRASRVASDVAGELSAYARELRRMDRPAPPDPALRSRAMALGLPEWSSFDLAQSLPQATPQLVADAAERFALRVRRRVAFERKMLARTASGRRRGAVAAALPGGLLLMLGMLGVDVAAPALAVLLGLEVGGCWLLWRVARVDI